MPLQFAVIGNPIAHSMSPQIHQIFGQETKISLNYTKILGDEACFEQQVTKFFAEGGKGLNVTLPFKQRAFSLAKHHTPRCQDAKAANTLWVNEYDELCADNTDGVGLIRALARHIQLAGCTVLILGAGGATRGIIRPLLEQNLLRLVVANRTMETLTTLKNDFPAIDCLGLTSLTGRFDIIINATSAGLTKGHIQLPSDMMATLPFCYDLSYDLKTPTPFVRYAKEQGCEAFDGFSMLVEQAAEAFYQWNAVKPSVDNVYQQLR